MMWSSENLYYYVEEPLHPQKIGVWAAVSKRRLIGPIFFEGKYTHLLCNLQKPKFSNCRSTQC
ncbi:hypothetical protein BDFB_015151 [Asbolus verrucosus]|uniref:Uncharacterized protein n=1 Tax=Asbolus verrucosus TaxID=1661398 RepID=A0A482VS22_ASBVE|nr:hypothetical protein BDFB_015151 [Asbolus verrucosus]